MSQEKVYALSLLACVLYAYGALLLRVMVNWLDSRDMQHWPLMQRLAYGKQAGYLSSNCVGCQIFAWVFSATFIAVIGFVPAINTILAIMMTFALCWVCVAQLVSD